jgi:hypothetical protein
MNVKDDLTMYSDDELSLVVMNTECLYNLRRDRSALTDAIEELYTFTGIQWITLLNDIADDLEDSA